MVPLADGDVFVGYTILRELGSGGMGEVYLAQHPRLPRHKAPKALRAERAPDHEYRDRIDHEASMIATPWNAHQSPDPEGGQDPATFDTGAGVFSERRSRRSLHNRGPAVLDSHSGGPGPLCATCGGSSELVPLALTPWDGNEERVAFTAVTAFWEPPMPFAILACRCGGDN